MNILRRLGVFFLGIIFSFLLFDFAFGYSLNKILTSPTNVKSILIESKIYNTAVNDVFDQIKKVDTTQGGNITFTDPAIKAAAEKSFTPAFLQQSTESVIDGIYGWLNGSTQRPEFRIDLTKVKADFAVNAGQVAANRALSLPTCPPALSGASFDAFSATCLPGGLTPAKVATQTQNDIANSKGFLSDPIITASSLQSSQSGEDIFATKYKDVPRAYQQSHKILFAIGLLSLLIAIGIIFLSKTRRRGLRRVGFALLSAGITICLLAWGLNYLAVHGNFDSSNSLASEAQKLVVAIASNVKSTCLMIGGAYLAIGLVAILGPMFYKRNTISPDLESRKSEQKYKDEESESEKKEFETMEDNEKYEKEILTPEKSAETKPKKSKKRALIQ